MSEPHIRNPALSRSTHHQEPPAPDGSTSVGWHADRAYWRSCTSDRMLTAWIPLVEITEDMGAGVIKGSPPARRSRRITTFNDQNLQGLQTKLATAGVPMTIVDLNVPLGCVSFHHCRTIHGSKPNRGTRPRIALTVHFQDRDNRYRAQHDEQSRLALPRQRLLCRRGPDGNPTTAIQRSVRPVGQADTAQ